VNATIAEFEPCVTPVTVGALGVVAATNELVALDAALSPIVLVATAVQVYVLPFVSVVTLSGDDAPVVERVVPPSLETHVTVKLVTAMPPLPLAVNVTLA